MEKYVGAVGVSSNRKSFNSWAIRTYTKSDFSHIFIVIGELEGRLVVLEADEGRVDINFISKYEFDKDMKFVLYRSPLPLPIRRLAIQKIIGAHDQEKYGDSQILGFALEAAGWTKNPFTQGQICSELVLRFLRECGIEDTFKDINLVDPEEVRKHVMLNGFKIGAYKHYHEREATWL